MVPERQAPVDGGQVFKEIFMVPAHEDHGVPLHEFEQEALHLHGLLPAVEQIAEDDQPVRLGIGEIPGLVQRLV